MGLGGVGVAFALWCQRSPYPAEAAEADPVPRPQQRGQEAAGLHVQDQRAARLQVEAAEVCVPRVVPSQSLETQIWNTREDGYKMHLMNRICDDPLVCTHDGDPEVQILPYQSQIRAGKQGHISGRRSCQLCF